MKKYFRSRQQRLLPVLLLAMILAATGAAAGSEAPAAAQGSARPDFPPAIVRCDPLNASATTPTPITVDLYLEDTQNTYGLDVQVTYDATIAKLVDQNGGTPGTQMAPLYSWFYPGFIIANLACNTDDPDGSTFGCATSADVGTMWYAANQLNPRPAVNGPGPFAKVTFQPLKNGTFTMHFFYHKLSDPNGVEVPSIAQDCTITFVPPTAVDVTDFSAEPEASSVVLRWKTDSELHHLGFNVLRADAAEGPWQQVNSALIPSVAPGTSTGHTYEWGDQTVEPGHTYYYRLEVVNLQGVGHRTDPIGVSLASSATIRPDPLESNVGVGQTFDVNLYAQDVVDLYGADVHLSFDPTILQVEDANAGTPGVQIQPLSLFMAPDFVIKQKACNAVDAGDPDCGLAGLAWYAAAELNPSPPATGSGPLAAITFKAVKAGASPLTITYQKLSDRNGVEIASSPQDGVVNVAGAPKVFIYLPLVWR